jgi:hypothetical protein
MMRQGQLVHGDGKGRATLPLAWAGTIDEFGAVVKQKRLELLVAADPCECLRNHSPVSMTGREWAVMQEWNRSGQ